jgi:hypothetical protein
MLKLNMFVYRLAIAYQNGAGWLRLQLTGSSWWFAGSAHWESHIGLEYTTEARPHQASSLYGLRTTPDIVFLCVRPVFVQRVSHLDDCESSLNRGGFWMFLFNHLLGAEVLVVRHLPRLS